jgi:hypothetical protein
MPDVGLAGAVGTSWKQRVSRPGAITGSSPAQGAVRHRRIGQRQRGSRCGSDRGVAGVSPLEGVTENATGGRRQGKAFPFKNVEIDVEGGKRLLNFDGMFRSEDRKQYRSRFPTA